MAQGVSTVTQFHALGSYIPGSKYKAVFESPNIIVLLRKLLSRLYKSRTMLVSYHDISNADQYQVVYIFVLICQIRFYPERDKELYFDSGNIRAEDEIFVL